MADIFISYSQTDRAWVSHLVDALSAEGYEAWWDLKMRASESFDELIEARLKRVQCVVVVWSQDSVKSELVRAESAWAKDHDRLVSIRIDESLRLPLKFNHVHTERMVGWDGSPKAAAFRKLVQDISALAPLTVSPDRGQDSLSSFRDPLRDGGEGPEMIVTPAGGFWMGSPEDDDLRDPQEGPRHRVEIRRPFALGRTTVTFDEYDRFVEATGRTKPDDKKWGRGRRPVINVSWEDAVAYAEWLCGQSTKGYRLPTEAEWEYAARAGTRTRWSFGDKDYDLREYAWSWFEDPLYRLYRRTHPVGEKKPNPWGLHDVHGNVWEWVQDCWHDSYEGAPGDGSAWGKEGGGDCSRRVLRGGSWNDFPEYLRSASRGELNADGWLSDLGFRLAQDL